MTYIIIPFPPDKIVVAPSTVTGPDGDVPVACTKIPGGMATI
jgi:hypothetical protein